MSDHIIKGWCPGALRPMLSGDGLVVRVRPRGGRFSADQVAGIAALAAQYGNGLIDLSSRANLQIRGVSDASYDALMAGLQALGLLDENAEAEARRNILVTPFWQAGDGAQEIAAGLALALAADSAPELPGKFGFAVDTGAVPVLGAASADIRIEQGLSGLICRADGADTGEPVTVNTAADAAIRLARRFVESGGALDGRGRMAAHIGGRSGSASHSSYMPTPGQQALGYLVGLEFGQISAAALAGLGAMRLTPWRMLLLESVINPPVLPGLIAQADDPLLRVVACTGAPGCPQGLQPTRSLARGLAQYLPQGYVLHISGCAKGCAMPKAAATVLVGQLDGYGVIRKGIAADAPTLNGLAADRLLADPTLVMGRL